ncbi:Zinc finger BED domain-containing protein [Trichinella pseudospiralis]
MASRCSLKLPNDCYNAIRRRKARKAQARKRQQKLGATGAIHEEWKNLILASYKIAYFLVARKKNCRGIELSRSTFYLIRNKLHIFRHRRTIAVILTLRYAIADVVSLDAQLLVYDGYAFNGRMKEDIIIGQNFETKTTVSDVMDIVSPYFVRQTLSWSRDCLDYVLRANLQR